MDNTPDLSIAIPTYNRSAKLSVTLDSILQQTYMQQKNIEIVISDNCSVDNTQEVVERYQEKYPFIKYFKNSENRGIDYNIYKCVDLSSGKYVQLISDDDIFLDGSLSYILNLIQTHSDISFFYLNERGFTYDADKQVFDDHPIFEVHEDLTFTDKNEFIKFLGVQITFVSAFLLHRDTWNINKDKARFIGTDIYLSYDLLHLLVNSNKYMFIAKDLIGAHKDYTAGNYRIFYAFAYQWRKLLLEEAVKIGFDKQKMRQLFDQSIKGLVGRIKGIKKGNINAHLTFQAWYDIVVSTYDTKVFWFKILPALLKPVFIYRLETQLKTFRRKLRDRYTVLKRNK